MADHAIHISPTDKLPLNGQLAAFLGQYLNQVETDAAIAIAALRDESSAIRAGKALGATVMTTRTQSKDHYQSAKALVAEVSAHAEQRCAKKGISVDTNPQRRAVWFGAHGLHVCARNLDGSLPSLLNPKLVWEIKEYWGKTAGGSKMSDAVYECQLVGRELREFEDRSGIRIAHAVFLDGRDQWSVRRSDLVRFIDLFHQGLIDYLIIGSQVSSEWPPILDAQ